jgi:hypothetical protein
MQASFYFFCFMGGLIGCFLVAIGWGNPPYLGGVADRHTDRGIGACFLAGAFRTAGFVLPEFAGSE